MSLYYVYILETTSNSGKKTFYTGYTSDLHRRINEHKNGTGARYCRGKKEIKLKYFETYSERTTAIKREKEIKSYPRKIKIKLVNSFNNN